jgi:glutamate--cysteine ligase
MADCIAEERPLTLDDLAAHLAEGCKPKSQFRIGAEHEKFVFHTGSNTPVAYGGPDGIGALLSGLQRFGWAPVLEGQNIIALERAGASVTLEPGGQFELSGAAMDDVHSTHIETALHLDEAKTVGEELGLAFLTLGFTPVWRREDVPVMPKGRYDIMRAYMPKVGGLGLDMMLRTCTVQTNLDFSSEADMVAKFRTSLALQPIATALFANSPFVEGKPSGFLSARANVWTDTDPDRTGLLDFVFEDGFGFETYARYATGVPMYFVKRGGRYINLAGRSFKDFMAGRLAELPGQCPSMKDWADHLTTVFPEVRLKQYLEMRGADTGPLDRICALQAFWVGILYDDAALAAAWDLCRHWTSADRAQLRLDAARTGLKGTIAGRRVQDVARDLVAISAEGLKARGCLGVSGADERIFLDVLAEIAESGMTPADRLLEKYHGPWGGDASRAFAECRY